MYVYIYLNSIIEFMKLTSYKKVIIIKIKIHYKKLFLVYLYITNFTTYDGRKNNNTVKQCDKPGTRVNILSKTMVFMSIS